MPRLLRCRNADFELGDSCNYPGSERTVHSKRSILPGPMPYSAPTPLRAALMAVQLPDADDQAFTASIAEMVRLGRTLGVEVVATVTQRRCALAAGTVVGSGKLAELKALAGQAARAETLEGEDDAKDEDEEKDEDERRTRREDEDDEDDEKDEDEDEEKDEEDEDEDEDEDDEDEDEEKNEDTEEAAPPVQAVRALVGRDGLIGRSPAGSRALNSLPTDIRRRQAFARLASAEKDLRCHHVRISTIGAPMRPFGSARTAARS